jgi:hypothetical protein
VLKPAGRWDWYEIPVEWARMIGDVPGIVIRPKGTIEIHRTHLPLLAQHGLDISAAQDATAPAVTMIGSKVMRPWQATGHAWLKPRRGAILADALRLGKTGTALSMHDPSTGPLMILAPIDVRRVWLQWIADVFPGANVMLLEGRTLDADALRAADIIFGHYDVVVHHRLTSLRPGTLIIDEAHLLANSKSRRTEGVRFFAGQAHRVLVLTGTPLWNHTRGLWPLLAMAAPGAWGGKSFAFLQRYCQPVLTEYGWRYGGISNEEEWYARRTEVVLARTWQSERPDLAPPRYTRYLVGVDRALTDALDDAAAELTIGNDQTITAISRYRQLIGRVKAEAAITRALSADSRAVVWTWHKSVAMQVKLGIEAAGRPAFIISGKEPVERRLAAIDEWSVTPGAILAATLAVGQVGIDLSAAPRAIMAELDWTPVVLSQAAMRTFDPTRPMTIEVITADHPVESLLVDRLLLKLNRAEITQMPAADAGFHMGEQDVDEGDLLAHLDEIVGRSAADFSSRPRGFAGGL